MIKLTKKHYIILLIVFVSIISAFLFSMAFSGNQPKEASVQPESNQEEIEESEKDAEEGLQPKQQLNADEILANLPSTLEKVDEIVNYPVGGFSGRSYRELNKEEKQYILEHFEKLPIIEDSDGKQSQPAEEEIEAYWRLAYSLFHENYPGPNEILKELNTILFGRPDLEDDRYRFKEHLNVEIILDASGSMAKKIDGKPMMDMAKEAIKEFTADLPNDAHVALRVYGHKGSGSNQDKKLSCSSNELVYPLKKYSASSLNSALRKFKPSGWTPLAKAIEEAKNDLKDFNGENHTNIIYLVSDGVETCEGDPVKEAKELADSNITPIVNIIGFNVDSEGQRQLKEIADAAKGTYTTVLNQEGLSEEFDRSKEIAQKWEEWVTDAVKQLEDENNHQWDNIFNASTIWLEKNKQQRMNIMDVTDDLHKSGQINKKSAEMIKEKANDQSRKILKLSADLRDGLWVLKDKKYEEVKEEIDKLFNENVERLKNREK
ncbi:vWA domain-containing protein [Cytobacillus solani]|uniref:vWA domain-containing protein n=1 Tax=Cytobacillus solani TaxID=1637975 RepID=UPI0006F9F3B4|nr:VWA domain-containing protein [Cytobacillus solani]